MVFWGTGIKAKMANRLNKLIRKAGSVVSSWLTTLKEVEEQRMPTKQLSIMENTSHPPHETVNILRRSFSNRMIQLCCFKERYKMLFLPGPIRLFSTSVIRHFTC